MTDSKTYPRDTCPFCGAEMPEVDCLDEDHGVEDGTPTNIEEWACGACGKQWNAIFKFDRWEENKA